MNSMRAAVLEAPGRMRVDDVAVPEPGAGEVRVRLEGCGVCASNLTPWAGPEWMQYPTEAGALGHEGWGTIDSLGEGVRDLAVGDRVAALSYKSYAGYAKARRWRSSASAFWGHCSRGWRAMRGRG